MTCPKCDTDAPGALCNCGPEPKPEPFDLTDYGDMRMIAQSAIGKFPRVEVDPAHVVALIDRISRLNHVIRYARHELRSPSNPDCPRCWGGHDLYDDHGRHGRCDCHEVQVLAGLRWASDEKYRQDSRKLFEREHGHAFDVECKSSCPCVF